MGYLLTDLNEQCQQLQHHTQLSSKMCTNKNDGHGSLKEEMNNQA